MPPRALEKDPGIPAVEPRNANRSTSAPLSIISILVFVLACPAVQAGMQPNPVLRVESDSPGEIGLDARGVTIEAALRAIASKAGFDVVIEPRAERPPVNMVVSKAPVEEVLRQILRGRNYALRYDARDALRQVIVLPPPPARTPEPMRRIGGSRWVR